MKLVYLLILISTTFFSVAQAGDYASSIKLKRELYSAVKDATESLTGDDCSVSAMLSHDLLRVKFEVLGPAEVVIFESKGSDTVVERKGGTNASPSMSYIFIRDNIRTAVIETVSDEDMANVRFNFYNASNKLIRTCLYQE